jgi:RNA polymerase sigma-70 factor, ECF subfamily
VPDIKTTSDNNIKLDSISFGRLFNELYPALCRHCIKFVRIPEVAEEIVQDQFVNIWEKRDELQIRVSYKSYLFKAVEYKAIDYLRSKFAKIHFVGEEFSDEASEILNPLHKLENEELAAAVTKALEHLPERCYIIFSMSWFSELTNKQIAQELNISEKTVENQITIALKKLKILLGEFLSILIFLFFIA